MSRIHEKKIFILSGMLVLLVCVGFLSSRMGADPQDLQTSADYVNYEEQQMLQHDGEVLVDSLNLTSVPGTVPEGSPPAGATGEGTDGAQQEKPEVGAIVTSDDVSELENSDAYFGEVRATLNMDRNDILSMLTSVIEETAEGPEKTNATQQKLKIIGYMEKENVVENLIENKGFAEALVVITDTSVNVTINQQELTKSDVAKITDIVMRETGRGADQIVIQTKF